MITVRMDWHNMAIEVTGHAGAAKKGEDLICAAASMLTQALERSLHNAQQRGRLTVKAKMEEGHAKIQADPEMSCLNETKAYFRMCVTGMRMLAEEYPRYINVKEA